MTQMPSIRIPEAVNEIHRRRQRMIMFPGVKLGRGYSLVWDEAAGRLLRDATETEEGRRLRIQLHRGAVRATVESRESE